MLVTSDFPALFVLSVAFVFGALWGSFFNVAIYRWPREMSVVTPPSHCPACGTPIRASQNIPIFGYFMLKGKAACCGATLSPRYVIVELLGAALCVAVAAQFIVHAREGTSMLGACAEALVYFAFAGALLIATFVDLEHMEIPDEVSLPGAALGLATAGMRSEPGAESAALGAGGGFLTVQLIFVWSYERLTGRRGMGEGDSKLLMMIGAFLGWRGALFALVAGAFQGLIAALVSFVVKKPESVSVSVSESESESESESDSDSESESESESESDPDSALKIPFGPFLALGALEFLFFGEKLIALYTNAAGF